MVWRAARRGARGGHFLPIKNSSGPDTTSQATVGQWLQLIFNWLYSSSLARCAHIYIFVYNIHQVVQHLDELLFRNITEYQIYAIFSLQIDIPWYISEDVILMTTVGLFRLFHSACIIISDTHSHMLKSHNVPLESQLHVPWHNSKSNYLISY